MFSLWDLVRQETAHVDCVIEKMDSAMLYALLHKLEAARDRALGISLAVLNNEKDTACAGS